MLFEIIVLLTVLAFLWAFWLIVFYSAIFKKQTHKDKKFFKTNQNGKVFSSPLKAWIFNRSLNIFYLYVPMPERFDKIWLNLFQGKFSSPICTLSSKKYFITKTGAEFEIEINFPICKQSFNTVFFGLL